MISRAERTAFGEWWWTVDRLLLFALFGLMLAGIVLSLAASPAVAHRLGLDTFHFVNRQVFFLIPATVVLIITSFLSPRWIRRLAFAAFVVALVMVVATLFIGAEIKGARRWLNFAGVGLQPSEFLKPAFVVLAAWLFAESAKRPEMPANILAILLLLATVTPLVMQPDVGQTTLITVVWAALFFMAGMRWLWVFGLAGVGAAGLVGAYYTFGHVRRRIDKFLEPGTSDTFQVDVAIDAFQQAGWFGKGPGEGTVKRIIPDSHTDFIFAVAAEEFGVMLCLVIVALFAFIVLRSLGHAYKDEDPFCRFAVAGLAMLFGLQSCINLMVNLHLIPPKGMTLPFVSYGGSSLIALAFGTGMLIALTRRRPRAETLAELSHYQARS
ncbi:FtsW/RodA/SpoVE family cell cycle protein [Phreatobacter sp. AB_2022a]|uniref:FtsW/RodA/SpoVE family cell cycle protein n=1 Tax=Phreatobacter sp. AB_2022a TaxID=3003134 RepID=UPI002287706E|nr:putative peptidoglycan glycosyltransferase FtsW [Phreatobacter sp. AB_2022a]MCZ0738478.1 putative peptidoglycan glycosyltransferase FtsW [Phreatobacter sp. AB_2022a]